MLTNKSSGGCSFGCVSTKQSETMTVSWCCIVEAVNCSRERRIADGVAKREVGQPTAQDRAVGFAWDREKCSHLSNVHGEWLRVMWESSRVRSEPCLYKYVDYETRRWQNIDLRRYRLLTNDLVEILFKAINVTTITPSIKMRQCLSIIVTSTQKPTRPIQLKICAQLVDISSTYCRSTIISILLPFHDGVHVTSLPKFLEFVSSIIDNYELLPWSPNQLSLDNDYEFLRFWRLSLYFSSEAGLYLGVNVHMRIQ